MTDTTKVIPQNPMQPAIQGYRKFDEATSDFINRVKSEGVNVQELLDAATAIDADPYLVTLAKTHFQIGAMFLIRSAAKPEGLF